MSETGESPKPTSRIEGMLSKQAEFNDNYTNPAMESAEKINKIIKAGKIDSTTGLKNNEAFKDDISLTVDNISRGILNLEDVSFTFIDVDFLKPVNEVFGHHLGGDNLLFITGQIIELSSRENEPVFFVSDDEVSSTDNQKLHLQVLKNQHR